MPHKGEGADQETVSSVRRSLVNALQRSSVRSRHSKFSSSLPEFNSALIKMTEMKYSTKAIQPEWSRMRRGIFHIVESMKFKLACAFIIIVNLFLVVVDTDAHAKHEEVSVQVAWTIRFFLLFYVIDILLRCFVYRLDFLWSKANLFDILVVVSDVICEFFFTHVANFGVLRALRLMKVLRVFRMFLAFRELFLMLHGLLGAMKAILWATVLIAAVLTMSSIIAVEYIHPLNVELAKEGIYNEVLCPRCKHAFESVLMSNLTFLQNLVAGGEETPVTVPIMEKHPWTALVFLPLMLLMQLALLNLVIACVCDAAHQTRILDEHLSHAERAEQMEHAKGRLLDVIREMDKDGSGTLTYEELLKGYDEEPEFIVLMQLMDIPKGDLQIVFDMLDADGSGDVDYSEWVRQLNYIKNTKEHTLLIFIKHFVTEMRWKMKQMAPQVKAVEAQLSSFRQAWDEERVNMQAWVQSLNQAPQIGIAGQGKKLEGQSGQTLSTTYQPLGHACNFNSQPVDVCPPAIGNSGCSVVPPEPQHTVPATLADLQKLQATLDYQVGVLSQMLQDGKEVHMEAKPAVPASSTPDLPSFKRTFFPSLQGATGVAEGGPTLYGWCQGHEEAMHEKEICKSEGNDVQSNAHAALEAQSKTPFIESI